MPVLRDIQVEKKPKNNMLFWKSSMSLKYHQFEKVLLLKRWRITICLFRICKHLEKSTQWFFGAATSTRRWTRYCMSSSYG